MDDATTGALNALNQAFYRTVGDAFDATRGAPWPGWKRLLPHLPTVDPLAVLDIGCGNGRFAAFLARQLSQQIQYTGIDSDDGLLNHARAHLTDVPSLLASLAQLDFITDGLPPVMADVVVLFGILHHVPGRERRLELVHQAASRVTRGGLLAFACWRFAEYDRFIQRAVPFPEGWATEPADYLLDWREGTRALRYCHYIDDAETDDLVAASGLALVEAYRADGFSRAVNAYRLLRRE